MHLIDAIVSIRQQRKLELKVTTDKYQVNRLHYNYAVAEVTSGQPGHVAGGGGGAGARAAALLSQP